MARNTPTWDDVRDAFRVHKVVVTKYLGLLHEIAASRTPMEWDAVNPLLDRMQ